MQADTSVAPSRGAIPYSRRSRGTVNETFGSGTSRCYPDRSSASCTLYRLVGVRPEFGYGAVI